MALTLFYPSRIPNFPRSYIDGFVGSSGMSNMAIVGQALDFDYLFPLYHVHMPITTRFYNATSNVYSLDFVFDGSAATITLSGVPISASALVNWTHLDNEDGWRIWVLATLAIDPSVKVDLPPVTPVWP